MNVFVCVAAASGWLAGARAKHASLQSTANCMSLFAAYASSPGAISETADVLPCVSGVSSWRATDGFKDESFISFADESYAAMRDDESRTPFYKEAIVARLADADAQTLVVLDIGTGPHAVLALIAARAGARKVYAIEASAEACGRARATVERAGLSETIEIFEGFSTEVSLPEKVDVVVSEIVGSIASEEGAFTTIRDAHARFVKRPTRADSWIPYRVETWASPCSYALQYALDGDGAYDWGRVREPLRLSCSDATLLPLHAEAQRVETIEFTDPELPSAATAGPAPVEHSFVLESARLEANEQSYYEALRGEGVDEEAARLHAGKAARSLSGLAMWCRLVLSPPRPQTEAAEAAPAEAVAMEVVGKTVGEGEGEIVVETRGAGGEHAESCWQTVLPLLANRPVTVAAGSVVWSRTTVELPGKVDEPLRYSVQLSVSSGS